MRYVAGLLLATIAAVFVCFALASASNGAPTIPATTNNVPLKDLR